MDIFGFEKITNTKKLIEKIKKACSNISKFNINSPCLLQFIRTGSDYEVVLTHDPTNGTKFDYYKIFEVVTYDEFYIEEEDLKLFETADERTSVPVIISTIDLNTLNEVGYNYSRNSYYVFPKFVFEAIKNDVILDFEVKNNYSKEFIININLDASKIKYKHALFIPNSDNLDFMFNISLFPTDKNNSVIDTYNIFAPNFDKSRVVSRLEIDNETWNKLYETSKLIPHLTLENNKHKFSIYHNDFLQKSAKHIDIFKIYEDNKSIVTLYFKVKMPDSFQYFKYRYYEV